MPGQRSLLERKALRPALIDAPRSRARLVVCAIVTIVAGLGSRKLGSHLPRFVAEYAGDALYATLMVFFVAIARPRAPTWLPPVAGFVVSALVEVSQLSHAGPLEAIRATTFGRLVLGTTFVWSDFPCYLVGALVGGLVARLVALREGPAERGDPPPPLPP